MISRRNLAAGTAAASLSLLLPALARAQRNLTTITVGFAPGGPGEVLARRLAQSMQTTLGGTVIVNNRPGAGGMLAASSLKGAATDGSVLLFSPPGIVTTLPHVNKKLPYDPALIEPVAGICEFAFAFAVRADHPAKNLGQFVDWARKQPQGSFYGVLGLGNMPHFIGYRLGRDGGFAFQPVAYKGAKEVVNDMLGGSLPSGMNVVAGFSAEHKAGTLRVLATTGRKRSASLPDVPTFAEQGFPEIVAVESFGFYAPAGIPREESDRIYKAVQEAVTIPDVRQFMALNDFEPMPMSAAAYKAVLEETSKRWVPVIRASGFQLE